MTVLLLFLVLFIKRIERTIFFIITMISILVLTNLSQSNYFKIINYSFYIFACLLLFILILDLVVKGKKLEFKFQMLDVLVLMYFISIMVSYLHSYNREISISFVVSTFCCIFVAYFLGKKLIFLSKKSIISFSKFMLLVIVIFMFLGHLTSFLGVTINLLDIKIESRLTFINGYMLPSGLFGNPNGLGMLGFLGMPLALLIVGAEKDTSVKNKIIYLIMGIYSLIGVCTTISRTAIFSSLIASGIILMLGFVKSIKKRLIIFVVAVLSLSIIYAIFLVNDSIYNIIQYKVDNSGLSNRDRIWASATEVFTENIMFGVGPGGFSYSGLDIVVSTHNAFLNIAVSGGIFSLLPFILIFILIVYKSVTVNINIKDDSLRHIIISLTALILGIALHQNFENAIGYGFGFLNFLTFIFIGILSNCYQKRIL
ncbi:TPA: O-antigen ligase family protein [Bacillus mobilis]|nr:O-antigen ligase family protein [Bacillus mobilis]